MFCTRSCWNSGFYDCKYLVSIDRIGKGKGYHDEPEKDWTNLTEEALFFDGERYEEISKYESLKDCTDEELRKFATNPFRRLKSEVLQWLNANVKDRDDKEQPKGWCCGDDSYLKTNSLSIHLFFHRKSDALAFIKEWSVYNQPTTYFDYFREIRKELDLNTNELVKVAEFSK